VSRAPRTEPSLPEWAALGVLSESATHGWAVAEALGPKGEIGRVHTVTRPLVYRALRGLETDGLIEVRGTTTSEAGPDRTILGATRRGRSRFNAWRGRASTHVRDLRSELMLKLLFLDRSGIDPAPLLAEQQTVLARTEAALVAQLESATGFDRTLALWRLSVGRAALSFVESLLDSRAVEPVVYRPIGYVRSPHDELDGMPLQAMADTKGTSTIEISKPHFGCLADLEGFSHVWVVAHLHEVLGWGPTVRTFLDDEQHGTFATRSPRRPNPVGLSLARIVEVEKTRVVLEGLDLLDGTPVLDLKPYVPLFDTPPDDVRFGWFERHADGVFTRTSDDRFALRSRRV
jgi:tRNA-Thr(GGU) m(6)t(6)A37 methyltransferase TsaA